MPSTVSTYFGELTQSAGESWNSFWFEPTSGTRLAVLRHIVGLFTLVWLISFSLELKEMFGVNGWVSVDVVHQTTVDGDLESVSTGFSHLFLSQSAGFLWICHVVALVVAGCLTLGLAPKLSAPLSLLVVLSYIHRAPMMTTPFETVLCMLLLYLSVEAVATFSLKEVRTTYHRPPSWFSNLATRLIQVHLCGIYVLIALSKVGTAVWWNGEAAWYLLTDYQHRLVNLDALTESVYALNAITHFWLLSELVFPILIWNVRLRPLVIGISTLVWLFAMVVTGHVGYCLLMLAANMVFLELPTRESRS